MGSGPLPRFASLPGLGTGPLPQPWAWESGRGLSWGRCTPRGPGLCGSWEALSALAGRRQGSPVDRGKRLLSNQARAPCGHPLNVWGM